MQLIAEPTEEGREKMTDRAPLPYDFLPEVPAFTVSSTDVAAGEQMSNAHVYNSFGMSGDNISPTLSWSGFPAETKSFAVTVYDPDVSMIGNGGGAVHCMCQALKRDHVAAR